ncbi:hypothetical protein [Microvirga lotononidis]|uniref:Uncharacterized protein n=1 Tax=Microvirga lotononidis TaxID=864069 RepID=I4Z2Q1_9HYPH|nr:hypothetical protein [Microvirga lotononidis]EIM30493.1 hypothetical protein MicloDRAFT_00007430 [Microvirga lotononidis]WQO26329.1 hypothetical protein U0023_16730 [Microvirga lotononidis]
MEPLPSPHAYSVMADALSKFHTAPEWIQALSLVMVPVTLVGLGLCLLQAVKEIAAMALRRGERQGEPLYAIYRTEDGRLMMYARGVVRELQGGELEDAPLPGPIRRH